MSDVTFSDLFVHAFMFALGIVLTLSLVWYHGDSIGTTSFQKGSQVMEQALMPLIYSHTLTRAFSSLKLIFHQVSAHLLPPGYLHFLRGLLYALLVWRLTILQTLQHCQPPHSCLESPQITSSISCHTALKFNSWQISSPFYSICPQEWRSVVGAVLLPTNWGHCCISGPPPSQSRPSRCSDLNVPGPVFHMVSGRSPTVQGDCGHRSAHNFSAHTLARDLLGCKAACCHTAETKKTKHWKQWGKAAESKLSLLKSHFEAWSERIWQFVTNSLRDKYKISHPGVMTLCPSSLFLI